MNKKKTLAVALAAVLGCPGAYAVSLGADGTGQALIYPYYTVRSVEGGQFNTYISVVNATNRAKAIRVNVREAKMAQAVASFNLFLSPNDAWTGAIVPTAEGARLVSSDTSCTEPAVNSLDLHNRGFSGSNADGLTESLDRTREGYVEMLEMATLTGPSAAAVTHTSFGTTNCAAVQPPATLQVEAPSGGLSGSLTIIDIARGMDFTVNAEALDHLARQPYYRASIDPYPDFNAAEIDPVSTVLHDGVWYRSQWNRPQDAVSAVLVRTPSAEYVLDAETRSNTDLVMTMPTRRLHTHATVATPPFTWPAPWAPSCGASRGERISITAYHRETRGFTLAYSGGVPPPGHGALSLCAPVAVVSVSNYTPHAIPANPAASNVLGYIGLGFFSFYSSAPRVELIDYFRNGWVEIFSDRFDQRMVSLPSSSRMDLATGTLALGSHTFSGLPIVGFSVRTFMNGTLDCGGRACQGNFGGAFPFRYRRVERQ